MATTQHLLLSPAELAYLHNTLSLTPPLRPDGRTATQFRPLTAETGILPGTNGSARICFSDGTEAVVGAKAEVERTKGAAISEENQTMKQKAQKQTLQSKTETKENEGENDWLELTVEIPGYRDDDSSTIFLATMLSEALLADGELTKKLWINRRFHWKLYLDIILISPPLSYPLPLLSLTTHLALLSTRLPRLKSEGDEDPMFSDDWAAALPLYSTPTSSSTPRGPRPPITLLVMSVGSNIIFDPSKEELAVADCALAISVGEIPISADSSTESTQSATRTKLQLLSVRTIDPPSRLTAPGVPNAVNAAEWGQGGGVAKESGLRAAETGDVEGVWKAPRGGTKIGLLGVIVNKVLEKGGVAEEVLEGLECVELS
ncbi:hypothetical protein F5Y18DRAFT_113223 [Xylariaceae sp. FL1019]|nr:hypothetical protein F5Y18DRAFT_113223 [Xylariaceae sp. FL1019]